jgi:hypothetical protein
MARMHARFIKRLALGGGARGSCAVLARSLIESRRS